MTFKCLFGQEENGVFMCTYDNQPCESPIGSQCRIYEEQRKKYYEPRTEFLKCEECEYEYECPVQYSYLNAACITLQRPKSETNYLLNLLRQKLIEGRNKK